MPVNLHWSNGGLECRTERWQRNAQGVLPSVHQHVDGTYWWYDETWADEYGPFVTQLAAEDSCKAYATEVLGV